jgi:hypothetical protein
MRCEEKERTDSPISQHIALRLPTDNMLCFRKDTEQGVSGEIGFITFLH